MQFVSPDGNTARSVSADIKDGRYVAPGVPLGKVRVMFTAVKDTGQVDSKSSSQPIPIVVNLIPERHAGGVDITVSGDKDDQNFDLKSR